MSTATLNMLWNKELSLELVKYWQTAKEYYESVNCFPSIWMWRKKNILTLPIATQRFWWQWNRGDYLLSTWRCHCPETHLCMHQTPCRSWTWNQDCIWFFTQPLSLVNTMFTRWFVCKSVICWSISYCSIQIPETNDPAFYLLLLAVDTENFVQPNAINIPSTLHQIMLLKYNITHNSTLYISW